MVIGLIIGLRITADQQRPEQPGGRRCETIRTGENDNSCEKMQNVRGDSSDFSSAITADLMKMKAEGAIQSVDSYFEAIFRYSEHQNGTDPTWGFSDHMGKQIGSPEGTAGRRQESISLCCFRHQLNLGKRQRPDHRALPRFRSFRFPANSWLTESPSNCRQPFPSRIREWLP